MHLPCALACRIRRIDSALVEQNVPALRTCRPLRSNPNEKRSLTSLVLAR
jgi:hypothetical protein